MKRTAVVCLALSLLCVTAHAQSKMPPVTLSAADRAHVMQDTFVVSRTTAAIPDSVKQAWLLQSHGTTFRMAEPGQPFQYTDVMEVPLLPLQRLVFVAVSKNVCIVHYEHGGYAPYTAVAAFHLSGDNALLVYSGMGTRLYSNMTALRWDVWAHQLSQTVPFLN